MSRNTPLRARGQSGNEQSCAILCTVKILTLLAFAHFYTVSNPVHLCASTCSKTVHLCARQEFGALQNKASGFWRFCLHRCTELHTSALATSMLIYMAGTNA